MEAPVPWCQPLCTDEQCRELEEPREIPLVDGVPKTAYDNLLGIALIALGRGRNRR